MLDMAWCEELAPLARRVRSFSSSPLEVPSKTGPGSSGFTGWWARISVKRWNEEDNPAMASTQLETPRVSTIGMWWIFGPEPLRHEIWWEWICPTLCKAISTAQNTIGYKGENLHFRYMTRLVTYRWNITLWPLATTLDRIFVFYVGDGFWNFGYVPLSILELSQTPSTKTAHWIKWGHHHTRRGCYIMFAHEKTVHAPPHLILHLQHDHLVQPVYCPEVRDIPRWFLLERVSVAEPRSECESRVGSCSCGELQKQQAESKFI